MIRGGEMYGYELRKNLLSKGETLQLSYLYKTLKEMCKEGFLESRLKQDSGPRKRLYRLTPLGRKELGKIFGDATELIHDFYEDYVTRLPPQFFSGKFNMMMAEAAAGRKTVGCVITEPMTQLHRDILYDWCKRPSVEYTYLIKPRGVKADCEAANLKVLDGSLEDIPLKEKSLDALLVVDLQDAVNLKASCREFRRVLKHGGLMIGCCPFMGLGGPNDPLEVGEFMKRTKHELTGRPFPGKEEIKRELGEAFDYVDVASLSFLTSFVAGLKTIEP